MIRPFLTVRNAQAAPIADIPDVGISDFANAVIQEVKGGARISALFGAPSKAVGGSGNEAIRLTAVLAHDRDGELGVISAGVGDAYPSLTPECPQAHWFEREIFEQWGVRPKGHPWLKPIRFHERYANSDVNRQPPTIGVTDFFHMDGDEVHEVAVGPVHAGIIEPGHFRFQCHGEMVYHLEISLGYQHRGIERAIIGAPEKRLIHYMETLAGDTTVGHATAYVHAAEALAGVAPPLKALEIRGIALELERLANHVGDLGALAGDVGFLPTLSYCGRIRGDFLNMTALICGNRFGRGLICPGGVGHDMDEPLAEELRARLNKALKDVSTAVELLWETPSVMARFENTGTVSHDDCKSLGLVGPAARAAGVERDVRFNFPGGIFQFAQVPISTWNSGDVFARAYIRWMEIRQSISYVLTRLEKWMDGEIQAEMKPLGPEAMAVSLTEGWRGEICHVAFTDARGRFSHYKITDPSFHNWFGLAMSLRNQQISDFPLCNKSFNLSYCGHDL